MTLSGLTAFFASILFLFASALLWLNIKQSRSPEATQRLRRKVLLSGSIAVILHAISLSQTLINLGQITFNLANAISLIGLLASVILLLISTNKPTEGLGLFIFPLTAISTFLPLNMTQHTVLPMSLGSHVLISIAAYSILTLATAQAVLYAWQEKKFQKHHLSSLTKVLPPLQVMEKTLIQLVLIGFIFLSFALMSGLFFVEDLLAQHLAHKTFFALISWLVYGTLLAGRFQRGWRGQKAARYTLWAFFALLLSYIGTQFILNLMLP